MISSRLYYPIYFLIVTIATVFTRVGPPLKYKSLGGKSGSYFVAILLCVFLVLFIGFRPAARIFTDMSNYYLAWQKNIYEPFSFRFNTTNILFDNLFLAMSSAGLSITTFYLLMATIYFSCMLWACRKIFPQHTLFAFLVCLAAFSTLSYATNGIKAGAAASIFLLAIAYREKLLLSLVFAAMSYGFHHSMELPIIAFYAVRLLKNPKYYFYFWIFCFVISLLHIQSFMSLFASLGDEQSIVYLVDTGDDWLGGGIFRIDFVIYSFIPILIGRVLITKYKVSDKGYICILNTYTLCNAIWLLCMYASFTNRIAYLSWLMYPIVLIYPYLKLRIIVRRFVTVKNIGYMHLLFSLFMYFVYYGSMYR